MICLMIAVMTSVTTPFSRTLRKAIVALLGVGLLFSASVAVAKPATAGHADATARRLPLTTKSPEARRLVEEALALYLDRVEQAEAIEILRRAVKLDPHFAMGHEFLAQISLDSAEQVTAQKNAFSNRTHVSQPERKVIEWYQAAADHNLIPAITKMNDVVNQYPHDKWVVWMSTWWLMTQSQYERSLAIYERSGITDSPGLLNNMAYNYGDLRQFDKAFAAMDQYVALMPGDPNPQDSYAEILRMAGRFDKSVEHYRAALAINPNFYSSQFGIADTYSLMGDQTRARQEYEIGFHKFSIPELHQVLWQTREATTFVRESDFEGADKAFQALADYAHSRHISQVEADTYRQMAMYQPKPKQALALLKKADAALNEGSNSLKITIQQETAQILRARVELALRMGNKQAANASLEKLTALSESSSDKLIELAYHGATGAMLCSHQKYAEAVSHLEEDNNNPLSLELLAVAYQKTGDVSGVKRTTETLTNLNDPTLEQALVVPAFRKCAQDPTCGGNMKNVSLKHLHLL